jgi:RNA polymerase sigma factor (sigma-70 family)
MVTRAACPDNGRNEGADPAASGEPVEIAWELAYSQSRRHGASDEDARGSAADFVEHLLERSLCERHREMGPPRFSAWLRQCLRNFAMDAGRAAARHEKHETAWPERESDEGDRLAWGCSGSGPAPDAELLRNEFWQRISTALGTLPPGVSGLFLGRYRDGVPIPELALLTGQTLQATAQALYRARKRLPGLMERAGLVEAELRGYLAALSAARQGRLQSPVGGDD